MGRILRVGARFAAVAFIETLSLLVIAWLIPGIGFDTAGADALTMGMAAALVLAFLNSLVRPVFVLLTLPLNALTIGLPTIDGNSMKMRAAEVDFGTLADGSLVPAIVDLIELPYLMTNGRHML